MKPEPRVSTLNRVRTFACKAKRQWCPNALAFLVALVLAAVSISAQAQTLTVLHSFRGAPDGEFPSAGLVRDAAGNLYGTTLYGGVYGCDENVGGGTVFKLSATGKESVLHRFANQHEGCTVGAPVIRDAAGNLYGTNNDVVYKISAVGKLSVLYRFPKGSNPRGSLLRDAKGNLYGVTQAGGIGAGTVYKVDANGKETTLHAFIGGTDGAFPAGGLVRDAAGNLYGTTQLGGSVPCGTIGFCGTVFRLAPNSKVTVLYAFTGGEDGATPNGGLIRDEQGNFYGTTSTGGDLSCATSAFPFGCGGVFKLDKTGKLTVLHNFLGPEGGVSLSGLIRDSEGNLYGTTASGGDPICTCGNVFKLDTMGRVTVLHDFIDNPDGNGPAFAGLVRDAAGNLYGTTVFGGVYTFGTAFKIVP